MGWFTSRCLRMTASGRQRPLAGHMMTADGRHDSWLAFKIDMDYACRALKQ